jgi:competence protein ComEC
MVLNALIKSCSIYPALWFCGIYCGGIIGGWYLLGYLYYDWLIYVAIILGLIAIFFHFRFIHLFLPTILTLIFVLGMISIYHSLTRFEPNHLVVVGTKKVESFRGWISRAHYRKDGNHQYIMELTAVERDSQWQPASGKILLKQRLLSGKLNYGSTIMIFGSPDMPPLPSNPGEFNYRRYLQMNNIYFQFYLNDEQDYMILQDVRGSTWQHYIIQPVRNKIITILNNTVPPPTVDVLKALILGERQDIDRPIMESFQKSGVIHVLAISGLHVGFILLIFLMIFSILNLRYRLKIILTLVFLFIFVVLVDFKVPVLRASIMATIYFLAELTERRGNSMNIIGLAGLLILAFDPKQLFQAGFQFSFVAVGSILYGYPRLSKLLPRPGQYQWASVFNKFIGHPFIVSFAAVLGTTPLTWCYYGTFQLGALFINLLIIPAIGLLLITAFILIVIGALGFGFVDGLGILLHKFFMGILTVIQFFSSLPMVQIDLPNPPFITILILSLAIFLFFKLDNIRRIIYPIFLLLFLILIFAFPNRNNETLQVTFVNVRQGDGAIIQFPNQSVMVVDAGENNPALNAGERYMLPLLEYYNINRIKYMVGTHAHSDHIGGISTILKKVKVDTLVLPDYPDESMLYSNILKTAKNKNIPILFKKRGDFLYPDTGCRVYILHPFGPYLEKHAQSGHEVNNSSIVMKIQYAETAFLLTGDLEMDAEQWLLNYNSFLRADVLKVGHHGSKTSTSEEFISLIQPDYSVISVGRFNNFFHPSRRTVERLIANQAHPFRTDYFGAVFFQSDGKKVEFINWRN